MKDHLSLQEMKTLLFIKQQLLKNQSPTVRAITRHLGYSSSQSGVRILKSLMDKGLIVRGEDKKISLRKIDILPKIKSPHTVPIPIVGYVACGTPILAEEVIEGYLRVSEAVVGRGKDHFILKAMGDSMDKAGIVEGDYLVIKKDAYILDKDIVLAFIDDEATVKRYIKNKQGGFLLMPESNNPTHQPIFADENTVILGKVVHVIGKWQ
jgi:repressor LexA